MFDLILKVRDTIYLLKKIREVKLRIREVENSRAVAPSFPLPTATVCLSYSFPFYILYIYSKYDFMQKLLLVVCLTQNARPIDPHNFNSLGNGHVFKLKPPNSPSQNHASISWFVCVCKR